MFKYISEILKSFTPAQRITALLIILFSIVIISLGPSIINNNTSNCDELLVRVKSQETQIVELNKRVNELNNQLISGQKECTDNLIAKQKEIMDIVNGMINDAEASNVRPKKTMLKKVSNPDFSTPEEGQAMEMRVEPSPRPVPPIRENDDMVNKLKELKKKIQKGMPKK